MFTGLARWTNAWNSMVDLNGMSKFVSKFFFTYLTNISKSNALIVENPRLLTHSLQTFYNFTANSIRKRRFFPYRKSITNSLFIRLPVNFLWAKKAQRPKWQRFCIRFWERNLRIKERIWPKKCMRQLSEAKASKAYFPLSTGITIHTAHGHCTKRENNSFAPITKCSFGRSF